MKNYELVQLGDLAAVPCPCGFSRRAFTDSGVASAHLVDIAAGAHTHYHTRLTEVYVILEGEGFLELDGEKVPVRPLTAVMIRPGCRHRALGAMRILNVVTPPFDPADERHD